MQYHKDNDSKLDTAIADGTTTVYSSSRWRGRRLSSFCMLKILDSVNDELSQLTMPRARLGPLIFDRSALEEQVQILGLHTPTKYRKRTLHGDITSICLSRAKAEPVSVDNMRLLSVQKCFWVHYNKIDLLHKKGKLCISTHIESCHTQQWIDINCYFMSLSLDAWFYCRRQ